MADQKVDLIKKTYSKEEYSKVIDTQFSQLGVVSINEEIENTTTVNQFFDLYNNLFYDIPALGDTNSHEYLIKTSKEYINFDEENAELEALRAEIASLRRDLLQAQIEKAEALTGETISLNTDEIDEASTGADTFNEISSAVSSPSVNTTNTSPVGGGISGGSTSGGSSGGGGGGGY